MAFDQGHALVVGVGRYQYHPELDVPMTVEDARQIAGVIQDLRYCAYPAAQVVPLYDTEATRERILTELDKLADALKDKEDHTVLLFYSGHGEFGGDEYYLTTHDTKLDANNRVIARTGISHTELLERIRALKAKRALLIFNACYSGEVAPRALGPGDAGKAVDIGQNLPDQVATALLGTGEGRVVVTACREDQRSWFAPDATTTVFGQTLVDGLQGRGINSRRGYISVFDLYTYLFESVSAEVKRRWELVQEPELTISKGVGIMAVALYRGQQPGDALTEADRPETLSGAAREVDAATSQHALDQILSGRINLAAGRDISNNTIIGGDQINAQGAQGFVYRPTGPVNQVYGTQRNIRMGGGDYAEGNIDKRQGAFVSGGTVYGPVVGSNEGTMDTRYDASEHIQVGNVDASHEGQVALGRGITQQSGTSPSAASSFSGTLKQLRGMLLERLKAGDLETFVQDMRAYQNVRIDVSALGADGTIQVRGLLNVCLDKHCMTALVRAMADNGMLDGDPSGWQHWAEKLDRQST